MRIRQCCKAVSVTTLHDGGFEEQNAKNIYSVQVFVFVLFIVFF